MNKERWFTAPSILQKQLFLCFVIVVIIDLLSFFIITYIQDPKIVKEESHEQYNTEIETIGSKIDSEIAWRYARDSKTEETKKELSVIQSEIIRARDENNFKSDDKPTGIEELQREVMENIEKAEESNLGLQGVDNGIRIIKIQPSEYVSEKKSKNIEDTIPAGRAGIRGIAVEKGERLFGKECVRRGITRNICCFNTWAISYDKLIWCFFCKSTPNDKLNEGAMSGTGSSMYRLSKYYIERPESIQPLIQIQSGRIMDVI